MESQICQILYNLNFLNTIPKNNQISQISVHCKRSRSMRTDRQTDMTKLISNFSQFSERA